MTNAQEKKRVLQNTNIFKTVPDDILDHIIEVMDTVTFSPNQVIFNKGDMGTTMYIVIDGLVRIHDGDLIFRFAKSGDVFGEMAALDPAVRSATITAESDTTLFRLDQKDLYEVMHSRTDVAKAVIQVLCQRIRESSQDWAEDFEHLSSLEHELEIGQKIQAGFFPDKIPQETGWEIAAHFQAAREVAGDFYDAFRLPQSGRIGLVIGDVVDKGIGAALFMTLFRSLIRASSTSGYYARLNPDDIQPHSDVESLKNSIQLTNDYIAKTHGKDSMFATVFYGILDPATGLLHYINGGHDAPLIFNASGVKNQLQPTGPAVGLFPNSKFNVEEVQLEVGDTLLVFTDGVTDVKNADGEPFGIENLITILENNILAADVLLKLIQVELAKYMFGSEQFDDITMLAVRRE